MKVIKDNEHSFLSNVFDIDGRLYLSATVMLYFDLLSPDGLLPEYEMWPMVQEKLGKTAIFDQAMPKPFAEFLAAGGCYAPRGTRRNASEVSISVGEKSKKLNVFGDRFWVNNGGVKTISKPADFEVMEIKWERAYGGEDYASNPLGIGRNPVQINTGEKLTPLPNIENPQKLIGAPDDKPAPSGFGQYGLDWPQRTAYLGTYDEKWQRTRWPYFPEDMNYKYFNTAPEDQRFDGFLKGNETIEIINMHPDHQVITSKLPEKRMRVFVERKDGEDLIFTEVKTVIDTVWVFPAETKGVVIYRGTTEVKDEELDDVLRLYIAHEDMYESPQTIEHHKDAMEKKFSRKVNKGEDLLAKAKVEALAAWKEINDIPKKIQDQKDIALGKAPVPDSDPMTIVRTALANLDQQKDLLNNAREKLLAAKEKFGHIKKISTKQIDEALAGLDAKKEELMKVATEGQALKDRLTAKKDGLKDEVNLKLDDPRIKKALEMKEINIDDYFPVKDKEWAKRGHKFVSNCYHILSLMQDKKSIFKKSGYTKRVIRKSLAGYNEEDFCEEASAWGLEGGDVIIPQGYIFPMYVGAELKKITVYPDIPGGLGEPFIVAGSDEAPFSIGVSEGKALFVAGNEADAWLAYCCAGDYAGVLTMTDSGGDLPDIVSDNIESFPTVLVFAESQAAFESGGWLNVFPNAVPVISEKGYKTLFEAGLRGETAESLILPKIPDAPQFSEDDMMDPSKPMKFPEFELDSVFKEVKAGLDKKILGDAPDIHSLIESKKDEFRNLVQEHGGNLVTVDQLDFDQKVETSEVMAQLDSIKASREEYLAKGYMTEEQAAKLAEREKEWRDIVATADAKKAEAKQRLADFQEKKKDPYPDEIKKLMEKHGMSPAIAKKPDMAEVQGILESGGSLRYRNLEGMDFSNMNLAEKDFSGAILNKALFVNAVLDGADFTKAICSETDFTKASLKGATMKSSVLTKAKLIDVKAAEIDLDFSALTEADLTGGDFTAAKMKKVVMDKASLKGATLRDAEIADSMITECDMSGVFAKRVKMLKCAVNKCGMTNADFSESEFVRTTFISITGEDVVFKDSKLKSFQILMDSDMKNADFSGVNGEKLCFMNSILDKANFAEAKLKNSMMEKCSMAEASFHMADANSCRFNKSNLESADMRGTNLIYGSLRKTRLSGADMEGSNLYSAELYKIKLKKTNMTNVNLKKTKLYGREDLIDDER